ncbi:MAG: hypothetical protein C4551_03155 [Bacillota bacterium]|nr:MAG: hypothetical protein C4551_03155 [Bacillota bacterium]
MRSMTREEMIAYLDMRIAKLDGQVNNACSRIAAAPIERTVRRNTALGELAGMIARRAELIRDMGDLRFGQKQPEDFPGYELFAEMEGNR